MKIAGYISVAAAMAGLLVLASCSSRSRVVPTSATQPECHIMTDLYSVTVNGLALPVEAYKDIFYVNFTLEGSASVRIGSESPIESCEVSPAAAGVEAELVKDGASFSLPGAGWWVVRINGTRKLFLLADKPEAAGPEGQVLDASAFVSGDGLQTDALQQALDSASATGKTLVFPRGIYRTGTLKIGGNTHVYLADGAIIAGSADRDDYPVDEGFVEADKVNAPENYTDNGERMTFSRLILIDNAENVSITGRGIIDGNGAVIRAQGKPANLIRIRNSKNVLIEGIILRDPAAWNTHIHYSDSVTIRDVKIINDATVPNTDGFDPDASRDVLIEHCFAYCSDDNVAVKTTNNAGLNRDLCRVTVKDCVFLTRKSSLKVGTETKAGRMSDIRFENNDVVECDRAFALYCNDGAVFEDIVFANNRIERNWPDSQRRGIHFRISRRAGEGQIRRVTISDCHFLVPFPKPDEVAGLDESHIIDGLTLRNVKVGDKVLKSLEDWNAKIRYTENIRFE